MSFSKEHMALKSELCVKTGKEALDAVINEWIKWNENEKFENELKEILQKKDTNILEKLFLSRLEFGTAGLRGRMGTGYNQMNDLVVIQTTQGLAKYLLSYHHDAVLKGNSGSVVIGFDGRHNSERFAKLAANVFISVGIKVFFFSDFVVTPFIPFTIILEKCWAGVVVTASHNPKDDNGYKVYWNNGCQIIAPHDKEIQKNIMLNLPPWPNVWQYNLINTSPLIENPYEKAVDAYFNKMLKSDMYNSTFLHETKLKFTYTAMHGVGYPFVKKGFETYNFKPDAFIPVVEQIKPDPEFPTVEFPNPEEGKSSLELSIKTANANKSTIILANDPDADRLAVAEKNEKNGQWKVFTGNELGALFGWWAFQKYKLKNPEITDFSNIYMLSSTVSSKILKSMAKHLGFNYDETLTGFKWLGNKTLELEAQNKKVLFAYEEAIGFMFGTAVVDKDGVSAAIKAAEFCVYLEKENKTLLDKLQDIYHEFGHHITCNSYFICHEPEKIKKIFTRLRTWTKGPHPYPLSILNGKYKITDVRDLTTGYDSSKPDKKATLPTSKSSQMITFTFANGLVATLRTSGTEPKIKYYTELCASPDLKDIQHLNEVLNEMVAGIINEFLQPEVFGLIARH